MSAALAPKIATLARLAAAGLPVPAYVALPGTGEPTADTSAQIDRLLLDGPVIVRAALFGEDTADTSGAGLGSSVPGCRDRAELRAALRQIAAALAEPWLHAYFGGPPRAQVLVQHEVIGPWLAVAALGAVPHVELHRHDTDRSHRAPEPLAAGISPTLAGPLALFPADLRAPLFKICDAVQAALPESTHGLDLELVADHDAKIWVVQARPLTRPLHPGWPNFAAAARLDLPAPALPDPPALPLPGLWTLDAEHNPAALSLAHAGLIRRLTDPVDPRMRVLAGWLYIPGSITHDAPRPSITTLHAALTRLQERLIPAARASLIAIDHALAAADRPTLISLVDRACSHLREILRQYAELPSRPARLAGTPEHPLSLQRRDEHLDVLPATWDIASPTLLNSLSSGPSNNPPPITPEDPDVLATLLSELDDHLFALGLAPLRRVYLRAANVLALTDDIFLLTPDELQSALRGAALDLAPRRDRHAAQSALFPPPQLLDGLPVPAPAGSHLRGMPIGPTTEGPLHPRRDLAELLADPPPAGAVLAIPALTAQAAVVLRSLAIHAVCCEHGGALSHAALMARELGLSALIGCRGCMSLPPGSHVRLDTRSGHLRVRTT